MKTDVLIVGSGCSALYMALHLPEDLNILMVTKKEAELSDSFLAQGGICMLRNEDDYDSYFEDTMKAGHYENDAYSVELMIKSSPDVIQDLINYGVDFERNEDGSLAFTREGAHSQKRILYHEDISAYVQQLRQIKNQLGKLLSEYFEIIYVDCDLNRAKRENDRFVQAMVHQYQQARKLYIHMIKTEPFRAFFMKNS